VLLRRLDLDSPPRAARPDISHAGGPPRRFMSVVAHQTCKNKKYFHKRNYA
jgi:hypothetical protein